jgi:biopolymer transport protein ExbB/TolQ
LTFSVVFFVLIISAIIAFILIRKRKKQEESDHIELPMLKHMMLDDVNINERIGSGNFGQVYKGVW